jgi:hypothetical protein
VCAPAQPVPVSSPSYFPPNRANGTIVGITAGVSTTGARNFLGGKSAGQFTDVNDLTVIGDSALAGGTSAAHLADANAAGSTIIGSASATLLTNFSRPDGPGPVTIVGSKIASVTTVGGDMVYVGQSILPNWNPPANLNIGANVIIGVLACTNPTSSVADFRRNVVIGTAAFASSANQQDALNNVFIGTQAAGIAQTNGVGTLADNVVIGDSAGLNFGAAQQNICIGSNAGKNLSSGTGNVCIGHASGLTTTATDNVIIGRSVSIGAAVSQNVAIGAQAGGSIQGNRNVYIGFQAATNLASNSSDTLYIQTFNGATEQGLIYGLFNLGNVLLGKSVATSREFGGIGATNVLKMLAGTVGNGSPVGGGYFVLLGANNDAFFVNSAGAQTPLSGAPITPAALGASVNNYQPAGSAAALLTAREVRLSTSVATVNVTGIDASAIANQFTLTLVVLETSTGNVVLTNQDAGSNAANRFVLPGLASLTLTPGSAVRLWYDGTSSLWRKFA